MLLLGGEMTFPCACGDAEGDTECDAVLPLPSATSDQGDSRWPVRYIDGPQAAGVLCYRRGTLLRQDSTKQLLLINEDERLIDGRAIRDGEVVSRNREFGSPAMSCTSGMH